jgi:hypothetical protein
MNQKTEIEENTAQWISVNFEKKLLIAFEAGVPVLY